MSERLDDLERRLTSVRELQDIVGAMLSLAGIRMQQAQACLDGMRSYATVMREALSRSLALLAGDGSPMAGGREVRPIVIVFTAEHGFTGPFNRHLLDALGQAGGQTLLVAGSRGAALCHERGIRIDWATPMATHVDGVLGTTRRISQELQRRFRGGDPVRVDVLYARHLGAGRSAVRREILVPLPDIARASADLPPLLNLPPARLGELLAEEYLFGALAHAGMESIASENGARLLSMQSARHNIDDKRLELERDERLLRQEEITVEMLDVVTGAAAMSDASDAAQ